jgi:hypothetical protein
MFGLQNVFPKYYARRIYIYTKRLYVLKVGLKSLHNINTERTKNKNKIFITMTLKRVS